jgi:hypothetical protein
MDLLYILGTGSVWENNEIRYSLRSVEKNVLDLGKVFVVGECPDWLTNIEHISCPDAYNIKWRNGYTKILKGCECPDLSEDFLLMNDDFFILKPIRACDYPYYVVGEIKSQSSFFKADFLTSPVATKKSLPFSGHSVLNYAVHRPMRINKKEYLEMPRADLKMRGFSPRTFYGNYYNKPAKMVKDINLTPLSSEKVFDEAVKERREIGIFSATAKSKVFREWIHKKFPNPSKYEK